MFAEVHQPASEVQKTAPIPIPSSRIYARYEEEDYFDDETETTTGATLSTIADSTDNHACFPSIDQDIVSFEQEMLDPTDARVSRHQNTYFMDGGNRFISLPTLGNTNTKGASLISRVFEEWLENKIYRHPTSCAYERLPILEDSVELLAEDIINKLKSRPATMTGLSRILIKVRTGHVYTYHQMQDGQPLITEDMEDFFQQFPLFVEVMIYTMGSNDAVQQSTSPAQLLLAVENVTINPCNPYHIMEEVQP